jgi:hypothetical protein
VSVRNPLTTRVDRKLAIGSGAIAATRTMEGRCCRSGSWRRSGRGEGEDVEAHPVADADGDAQVGSERRLIVGSRRDAAATSQAPLTRSQHHRARPSTGASFFSSAARVKSGPVENLQAAPSRMG